MSETFTPDNLIAGFYPQIRTLKTVAISQGALARGAVMGRITKGTVAAAVAAGGGSAGANTGAGTCVIDATEPRLAGCKPGTYHITFTAAAAFYVTDPDGLVIGSAVALGTFAKKIKFVLANSGTAHVAGDGWDIVVAVGSGYLKPVNSANIDGSEVPCSILLESLADKSAIQYALVAETGEFNEDALTFGGSDTHDTHRDALRNLGIFLKLSLPA